MATLARERGLTPEQVVEQRRREGAALRVIREINNNMTMEALAAGLNADLGTTYDRRKIADWEAGRRPIPLAVLRHLGLRVGA
ncbi:MAG: hypothetical protein ACLGJC_20460 [Alphaproteobacteria bacterium]|jgi:hypothetical protein